MLVAPSGEWWYVGCTFNQVIGFAPHLFVGSIVSTLRSWLQYDDANTTVVIYFYTAPLARTPSRWQQASCDQGR